MSELYTTKTEDYAHIHPLFGTAPALVTQDGDQYGVGEAHGRIIPAVGSTRPPIYDVSLHPLNGSTTRIYSDDPNEVLKVLIGEVYAQQLALCTNLIDQYDVITDDQDPTGAKRRELQTEFAAEQTYLGILRGNWVHYARAIAQQRINKTAKETGAWNQLSELEQRVLTNAADTRNPKAPAGVLEEEELPVFEEDGTPAVGYRGVWRADVPLVLNEADFYPWSDTLMPRSEVTISVTNQDGEVETYVDTHSNLNIELIPVDDADLMLRKLGELGALSVAIRPILPVEDYLVEGHRHFIEQVMEKGRNNVEEEGV